mmetsp:Transcript_11089/g.27518  ORF Transcript_11089/g.27518 Transcript_11089/m.27518 type:complete len:368 (-) Transcript_11089:262-1365(-)
MLCTASMFSQKTHTPAGTAPLEATRPAAALAAENHGLVASLECVRAKTLPVAVMQQLPPSSFSVMTTCSRSSAARPDRAAGAWPGAGRATSSGVAPGEKCTWGVRGYWGGAASSRAATSSSASSRSCSPLPLSSPTPPPCCPPRSTPPSAAAPPAGAAAPCPHVLQRSEQNWETKSLCTSVSMLPGRMPRSVLTASSAPIAGLPPKPAPPASPCLTIQHARTVPARPLPPPQCTSTLPPLAASASISARMPCACSRLTGARVLGTGANRLRGGGAAPSRARNHSGSRGSSSVRVTMRVMPSASLSATTCSWLLGVDPPRSQLGTSQLVFLIRVTSPSEEATTLLSLGLDSTTSGSQSHPPCAAPPRA